MRARPRADHSPRANFIRVQFEFSSQRRFPFHGAECLEKKSSSIAAAYEATAP
jgi:hypothetical protein